MKYFQFVDYIPWIGSFLAECFVLALMLRHKIIRRFPIFFGSVVFDVAREISLPAVAFYSTKAYSYSYWIAVPIEHVIAFAVMIEVLRYSIGADSNVATKSLRALAPFAVLLVAAAVLLILYPDISIKTLNGLALTLDRSTELLRCGVLLFIWTLASRLGITWRHHVWGIVFGLGIYSGTGLIVAAIHATTGVMCGDWLARVPHFAYLVTTIIWAIYLRRPEPERGPLTLQELSLMHYILDLYHKILTEIWRLFDGHPS